jgi:hypothetical protein
LRINGLNGDGRAIFLERKCSARKSMIESVLNIYKIGFPGSTLSSTVGSEGMLLDFTSIFTGR